MKFIGQSNETNVEGDKIVFSSDCKLYLDSGDELKRLTEATLKVVAGEFPILQMKVIGRNVFPQECLKSFDTETGLPIETYEFAIQSFEIKTKEKLCKIQTPFENPLEISFDSVI